MANAYVETQRIILGTSEAELVHEITSGDRFRAYSVQVVGLDNGATKVTLEVSLDGNNYVAAADGTAATAGTLFQFSLAGWCKAARIRVAAHTAAGSVIVNMAVNVYNTGYATRI